MRCLDHPLGTSLLQEIKSEAEALLEALSKKSAIWVRLPFSMDHCGNVGIGAEGSPLTLPRYLFFKPVGLDCQACGCQGQADPLQRGNQHRV